MIPLNKKTVQALFRYQKDSVWVGGVHMMNKFYEYVPFSLDDKRYVIKFTYPPCLNGIRQYTDRPINTDDGGIFIPQREHRTIKLLSVGPQGELAPMQNVSVTKTADLAQALYQVIEKYCKCNSMTVQFFFEAEINFGDFICNMLPKLVNNNVLDLTFHNEIVKPLYGFSVSFKLTR